MHGGNQKTNVEDITSQIPDIRHETKNVLLTTQSPSQIMSDYGIVCHMASLRVTHCQFCCGL